MSRAVLSVENGCQDFTLRQGTSSTHHQGNLHCTDFTQIYRFSRALERVMTRSVRSVLLLTKECVLTGKCVHIHLSSQYCCIMLSCQHTHTNNRF